MGEIAKGGTRTLESRVLFAGQRNQKVMGLKRAAYNHTAFGNISNETSDGYAKWLTHRMKHLFPDLYLYPPVRCQIYRFPEKSA